MAITGIPIPETQCIGDSLQTINDAFEDLDTRVTAAASSGVTKLIAGTNVTLSPTGGTGDVTINAASGGGGSVTNVTGTSPISVTNGSTTPNISIASSYLNNPWVLKTSAYTAVDGDRIAANTSGGAFTINLPASPVAGNVVNFADSHDSWDTNNLTIGRNGKTIEGASENLVCDVVGDMVLTLIYNGSTWQVYV